MSEEQARANQAKTDWERINKNEPATDLVLRLPQIKQAQANVASAQARLDNALLNLERTKILAPYAGRILTKQVDVGQYVSTGNSLAKIYAVDYAEIRLPLSERQLAFGSLLFRWLVDGGLFTRRWSVHLRLRCRLLPRDVLGVPLAT